MTESYVVRQKTMFSSASDETLTSPVFNLNWEKSIFSNYLPEKFETTYR